MEDVLKLHKDEVIDAIKGIASRSHEEGFFPGSVIITIHDGATGQPTLEEGYARFFLSWDEDGVTDIWPSELDYFVEVGKVLLSRSQQGAHLFLARVPVHNHGWVNPYQKLTSDFYPASRPPGLVIRELLDEIRELRAEVEALKSKVG